jgi:hypothetical protein
MLCFDNSKFNCHNVLCPPSVVRCPSEERYIIRHTIHNSELPESLLPSLQRLAPALRTSYFSLHTFYFLLFSPRSMAASATGAMSV